MVQMAKAKVVKKDGGFAIEFFNKCGESVGYFNNRDGNAKVWIRQEGAEKTFKKYGWIEA